MDSQFKYQKKFSFEFYPPRTPEATEKLQITQQRLAKLQPDFFSVTFGAGGSTREKTFDTVLDIRKKTGIESVPHVSCVGYNTAELKQIIDQYRQAGFKHIVALRGDMPSGSYGTGSLQYASELVELIRNETGDYFHIEVACYPEFHPQSGGARRDLDNFKQKIEAGANSAITQYFYNPYAYFHFIDSCERAGINVPIVPGVMPITNCKQLVRFSKACGAEIPRWILMRLQDFEDDLASIRQFGIDVTTELCAKLLEFGAPGMHIYTMNHADASEKIFNNLSLHKPDNAANLNDI